VFSSAELIEAWRRRFAAVARVRQPQQEDREQQLYQQRDRGCGDALHAFVARCRQPLLAP
jgi:hypothetical protein